MDHFARMARMDNDVTPHIIAVDRVNHGTCVYFSDGSQGFYPDALLYSMLKYAEPISDNYGET